MDFVADCIRCAGLCCVALSRSRAGGFGADAPAGTPCHHLQADNRCEIHSRLRQEGWPACTVFDCFGAGQQVTQVTFAGGGWREDPDVARDMFAAFATMRHLMEMLRLLTEARGLASGDTLHQVTGLVDELTVLVDSPAAQVTGSDIPALRARVGALLSSVSEAHRSPGRSSRRLRPGAHLLGADLRGKDLSRFSLRGALLIAADLRRARMERTDLLGADLRDARLDDADLRAAIFLTQQQLDGAVGSSRTLLPVGLRHPEHWT